MKKILTLILITNSLNALAYDMIITPDALAKAEKDNPARFKRDFVGKKAKVSGIIERIGNGHFDLKANGTFAGWTVYHNSNFIADLNKGDKITIDCEITDYPLIGGALKCE